MANSKDRRFCIRCGNMAGEKDSYCVSCGAPIINRCLNPGGLLGEPCGHINNEYSAFCAKCGSHTAYYRAGLVHSSYGENKVLNKDELDEMEWFSHPFFAD